MSSAFTRGAFLLPDQRVPQADAHHYIDGMRERPFGRLRTRVSEIGLGCWQLGGADWGDVSDEQALDTLRAAADAGVTFFDTADVYGRGRSETLIGRFLVERKTSHAKGHLLVATKLGRFPEPGWPKNFSLQSFRTHTEASLKRLGVEALDLTQLHCIPPDLLQRGEVFEWLRTLQKEGKIRHFGASVESMAEALVCVRQEGLVSLQIIFNIFRQKPLTELSGEARHRGVALIVRLPLASGLLGGKMTTQTHFAPDDHRSYNRDGQKFNVGETFAGLRFEKGVELADALKPLAPPGMTMAQMALRWCLDFEAVTTVIPGAKSPQQARENASVSEMRGLSDELHERLRTFYLDRVAAHVRGPY
jgi:aryl-alcohol dehydrogenase-like predicted oxidoreductase